MEAVARITRSLAQQAAGRIRGWTQDPALAAVDLTQFYNRGHFGVAMDLVSGPLPPGSLRQVSKSRFKAQALELRPYRPARPAADPRTELHGSVLRFEDQFAPVCENDWEALA